MKLSVIFFGFFVFFEIIYSDTTVRNDFFGNATQYSSKNGIQTYQDSFSKEVFPESDVYGDWIHDFEQEGLTQNKAMGLSFSDIAKIIQKKSKISIQNKSK